MGNYYFLTSLFSPLEIGHPPAMHSEELTDILREDLNTDDWITFCSMRQYLDLENLRNWLKGDPVDPRGNFTAKELEENIENETGLPDFVFEFLKTYEELDERLRFFPSLFTRFFDEVLTEEDDFLNHYFTFEREWRLVTVGFRAKLLDRDLSKELQYEDPTDTIVAQILAQKDSPSFEPPYGYENLKAVFETHRAEPFKLHKAFCEYRFDKILEMENNALFSMDRILGHMARLLIVEQWMELDEQEGNKVIDLIGSEET
ncbi:Uncharacterized protein TC_0583 [Chlamydiales bacterium SCGC AG-110-M15]|nr:Uncharacterized protein TC_0583 [Chlamydiales bacterium SCGC AG-110-M15]